MAGLGYSLYDLRAFRDSSEFMSALKAHQLKEELASIPEVTGFVLADYEELEESLTRKIPVFDDILQRAATNKQNLEAQYVQLGQKAEEVGCLSEFYKALLETLSKSYLDSLSQMLSEVYSAVYCNPDKSVVLVPEDYRGKKVIKLCIINNVNGQAYREDFSEGGGSLQIVLGIVIEVFFLLCSGMPRIIMMDESLSSLHDDVLTRFFQCLQKFVEELDFCFLVVDHSYERMLETGFVDKLFRVTNGEYVEVHDSRLRHSSEA